MSEQAFPPPQLNGGVGFLGFLDATQSYGSEFNTQWFFVWSILARLSTATLVRVVDCTNSGALAAVGFVDILPLVNQIDGAWNSVPHAVVYQCPYFRLQGGADAVIIDPKVGDIGIAVFAQRDISSVVASRDQANPGSRRMFDWADGLYIGGVLNGVPSQYVRFSSTGIQITSPTAVRISAPIVAITGAVLTHNGTNVGDTHVHGGVESGGSTTSGPS